MDWVVFIKYLHVISAVAWVGGGVVLFATGLLAEMRKDDKTSADVLRIVVIMSPVWFIPTSLLTLVFGLIMAAVYNLWGQAWIVLGLLGFLTTFCIGLFILKPTSEAFTNFNNAGQAAEAKAQGMKMLTVSKFDYVLLFSVIFDMVVRPQWGDILPLAIIIVAVAGGAALFLLPVLMNQRAAAA